MLSRKLILFLILFSVIAFLQGCGDVASYTNVLDPGDIKPKIELSNKWVIVTLKNDKGEKIYIKDGAVYINNTRIYASSGHYERRVTVSPDSVYVFEIILSNGDSHYAWIETPEINLHYIDLPDSHSHKYDLRVAWQEVDYRYPQKLCISWYDKCDLHNKVSSNTYAIEYPYKGEYIIRRKNIKFSDDPSNLINYARIDLFSTTEGVISEEFLPGGSISCTLSKSKGFGIY